jgi:hypothetical protein
MPRRHAGKGRRPAPSDIMAAERRIEAILHELSLRKWPRGSEREWLPVTELRCWFKDALGKDAFKKLAPNIRFEKLARDIQVHTNQYCNPRLDWYAAPDLAELKDVDPIERQNQLLEEVYRHANPLLAVLCKLEDLGGPGDDPRWKIPLSTIQEDLGQSVPSRHRPHGPPSVGRRNRGMDPLATLLS